MRCRFHFSPSQTWRVCVGVRWMKIDTMRASRRYSIRVLMICSFCRINKIPDTRKYIMQ